MQFSESDLDTILKATGEQIEILLSGAVVLSPWAKFRENFESVQSFESTTGIHHPVATLKTSVMASVTSANSFRIRGVEYRMDGKPERQPSGFTVVHLGVKK